MHCIVEISVHLTAACDTLVSSFANKLIMIVIDKAATCISSTSISVDNRIFFTPCVLFNAPAEGVSPWNWVSAQGSEETGMMGLPVGEKVLR